MAVGNRHVDVQKALKEAQDAIASAENIEWMSPASAVAQLKPFLKNSAYAAQMRICEHAYAKLVRAKARRYLVGDSGRDDIPVPHVFWWAKGHAALNQDWPTGSFSTYINDIEHRAFGLSFVREDIELMIPADSAAATTMPATPSNKVFLVHGHDEAARNEVALFLHAIGLDPIILHLRPNGGRHLLTKFREESEGGHFCRRADDSRRRRGHCGGQWRRSTAGATERRFRAWLLYRKARPRECGCALEIHS
jgi:hypothetical protein